jgi:hypothetical protein
MGANFRVETINDIATRGNIAAVCGGCGRTGVVDGPKAVRYFFCWGWDKHVARAARHFRCIECGGNPWRLGLTHDLPSGPEWGPRTEDDWRRLVKRMRG